MTITKKRYLAPGILAISIILAAGIVYLSSLSPSNNHAPVRASDVCKPLGSDKAVVALNEILPEQSEFSFDPVAEGTRVPAEASDNYSTSCFIHGDQDLLLSARARMMRAEPPESWESEVFVGRDDEARRATRFEAGAQGIASSSRAAAFIPCVPKGKIPGGSYSLSVVVDLKKRGDASDTQSRDGLIDLVLSFAKHAHKNASCTLPSRI
ncbi:hypothetical protein [Streptomyces sp. NPDC018584]|uniref:hypothetical protein n=1 Tax=unclassified Streptomyces TaxID=2593676 RepID=UPI00379A0DC9